MAVHAAGNAWRGSLLQCAVQARRPACRLRALSAGSNPLKQQLEQLLSSALQTLVGTLLPEVPEPSSISVERARNAERGDFVTNVALRLGKTAGRDPRELAEAIVAALPANDAISKAEVAGAGFINLFLAREVVAREIPRIHELGEQYGRSTLGAGQRVTVGIGSLDSTGPLDVARGRHAAYCDSLSNVLSATGFDVKRANTLEASMIQNVTLHRGTQRVKMTLRELLSEVGSDACRFFYLMRGQEQQLDFDVKLAASRTNENPVYYVQYAHARVKSVMKEIGARGLSFDLQAGLATLGKLDSEPAQALMTLLLRYPEAVEEAAINRAPHAIVYYLRELANAFHSYYNAEKVIVDDAGLRNARVALALSAAQVIRNGLGLLGISAPESM